MVDLNDYVCMVPFRALDLMGDKNYMCCPTWLEKELPNNVPLKDLWNSEEAVDIRESVMDGSYRHCSKTKCPFLSKLIVLKDTSGGPILHKTDLPDNIKKNYESKNGILDIKPRFVQFSFDRTCNFKCPSCRVDLIVADSNKIQSVKATLDEIEESFADSLEKIYCSGTADPFVSVSYRNFFRNFNPDKYPKLKHIRIHTNASMWNEEMWNSMPNIHKYVKTCEVSIDAGTAFTYENITRLGGKWDTLITNLKFIATIKTIESVKCSFVVQQSNYMEMERFLNIIYSIFGKKTKVFYGRIFNWGTFSDVTFKLLDVGDVSHPEHNLFLTEFKKVATNPYVFHNMYELLPKEKKLV